MKKIITTIALSISLLALALGSATYAYFSDTKKVTNTFTSGNVTIELSEAEVKDDGLGNLIEDTDKDRILGDATKDYGVLFPSQTIHKDPTIKNTGSLDAYLGAIVTVDAANQDLVSLIGITGSDLIDINQIIDGGVLGEVENMTAVDFNGLDALENDDYVVYQEKVGNAYKFYVFVKEAKPTNTEIELFTTVTIDADYDNNEMALFEDFSITVDAFGTQKLGFENVYDALTSAFDTQFDF